MNEEEKDRLPFQFICEDEVFNEDGLVIIHWNLTSECDVLKLNKSFIDEHHLWDPQIEVNGTYVRPFELRNHSDKEPCLTKLLFYFIS